MNANKRSKMPLNVCLSIEIRDKLNTYCSFCIEGKQVPTELRNMDKGSKEDFGYDQAQEGKANFFLFI